METKTTSNNSLSPVLNFLSAQAQREEKEHDATLSVPIPRVFKVSPHHIVSSMSGNQN